MKVNIWLNYRLLVIKLAFWQLNLEPESLTLEVHSLF